MRSNASHAQSSVIAMIARPLHPALENSLSSDQSVCQIECIACVKIIRCMTLLSLSMCVVSSMVLKMLCTNEESCQHTEGKLLLPNPFSGCGKQKIVARSSPNGKTLVSNATKTVLYVETNIFLRRPDGKLLVPRQSRSIKTNNHEKAPMKKIITEPFTKCMSPSRGMKGIIQIQITPHATTIFRH